MRRLSFDPTAGETARAIRARPGTRPRIDDPTDPRCGRLLTDPSEAAAGRDWILDPTDPHYGERPVVPQSDTTTPRASHL
jgi:hypothetical protein